MGVPGWAGPMEQRRGPVPARQGQHPGEGAGDRRAGRRRGEDSGPASWRGQERAPRDGRTMEPQEGQAQPICLPVSPPRSCLQPEFRH